MTPETLREWRKGLGLTQSGAAAHLGVSLRVLQYWESGEREIPRLVDLATQAKVPATTEGT